MKEWMEGRVVIHTEADKRGKGRKKFVGGEEGEAFYGGASERATKQPG